MSEVPFRQSLKETRLFGCIPAALLAASMGFIVFLGTTMGDCEPGPGCHDRDGLHIMYGWSIVTVIASVVGVGSWLLFAVLRMAMRSWLGAGVTNVILAAGAILIVWFGFTPAMQLLLVIRSPDS